LVVFDLRKGMPYACRWHGAGELRPWAGGGSYDVLAAVTEGERDIKGTRQDGALDVGK
jgi:hypothetical protein